MKVTILSLGRFGSGSPVRDLLPERLSDRFQWENHPLIGLEKWQPSPNKAPYKKIIVDLDALFESESIQNDHDLQSWKKALNETIVKCQSKSELSQPELIGMSRFPSWKIAKLAIQIGCRQLLNQDELYAYFEKLSPSPNEEKDSTVVSMQEHLERNRASSKTSSRNSAEANTSIDPIRGNDFTRFPSHVIPFPIEGLEGDSAALNSLRATIRKVAQSESSLLIIGETGTGKERVARTVHNHSPNFQQSFVTLDCRSLDEDNLDQELERVAKETQSGSLFIDQIHELKPALQGRIARFLKKKHDFRLIVSSQVDLREAVAAGNFREDLFYLIHVVDIPLPSLRQRRSDIPMLCESILKKLAKEQKKQLLELSTETLELFLLYDWPGNVRELKQVLSRGATFAWVEKRPEISPKDLPENIQFSIMKSFQGESLKAAVKKFEKEYIAKTIRKLGGSKEEAADALGLSLATLYRKLGS